MKKVIFIIFLLVLLSTRLFVFGQNENLLISIEDTSINLMNVEIKTGYHFPQEKLSNITEKGIEETVILKKAIFKSPCNEYYAIVNDNSKYSIGPDESYSSSLYFFDKNGIQLFEKHFTDAMVTNCLITKFGNLIFVEILSMERDEIHVYDKSGNLQRLEEKNVSRLRASYSNKIISIKSKDTQNNRFSIDIYIDGVLQNKKLLFEQYEPIVSFSSNEKIISIRNYEYYFLYDMQLELVKKISSDYHIYVFNNGNNYSIYEKGKNMYCEIKDFESDKTVFKIDNIELDSIIVPIYISGIINRGNDIYITAPFKEKNVFQFFTLEGIVINSIVTDIEFFGYGNLEFYKASGEYRIKTKDKVKQ